MSKLRHPNITQFLGICFLPNTKLPLLVMEKLEMSLDDLLEGLSNIHLPLKISFIEDVCNGLDYLHTRQPRPVVHRDLTAKNVLLTSSLSAKITDMGNSCIISPGGVARTLSKVPGTLVYMAPEAVSETHRYGPSLDVFSLGHLALYTLTQVFPYDLLSHTYPDPDNAGRLLGRSEVERREVYMKRLDTQVGYSHPALVQLVRKCLQNNPSERPSSGDLLRGICAVRLEVEQVYGGRVGKLLDIGKVMVSKEMRMKERKIKEMEASQERAETENRDLRAQLQEMVATKDGEYQVLQQQTQVELQHKDEELQQKDKELQQKDEELQQKDDHLQRVLLARHSLEKSMASLRAEFKVREDQLREEVSRLTEQLSRCWEVKGPEKGVGQVQFPLNINWKNGPDMPFGMTDYIQSVVVQGIVYVGGGWAGTGSDSHYIVMAYDTCSHEWHRLPPYTARNFAMAVINNQIVLIGGCDHRNATTNLLGAWEADSRKWTHPYPHMPTSQSYPSAAAYKRWLIVAGGSSRDALSTVDVLNVDSKQWCSAPPTPTPWHRMKSTIVGNTWYLMGGYCGDVADMVYSVSLPALISQANSEHSNNTLHHMWKTISGLGYYYSTPLSIGGSLLAVGGKSVKDGEIVSTIHRFLPETEEWVRVEDLPSPLFNCTCAVTSDGEVLVIGGPNFSPKVHFGSLM